MGKLSKSFWTRIYNDAKKRDLVIDISIKDAWYQFEKQNELCALTGEKLNFGKSKSDSNRTASLDRINSKIGYIKNNIQWVHKDINKMKQNFPEDYFLELIKKVYNFKVHSPK